MNPASSVQVCEKGVQQVDPNTGLVYFKYDFGYEFGVVVPGMDVAGGADKENEEGKMIMDMDKEVRPNVGQDVSRREEWEKQSILCILPSNS